MWTIHSLGVVMGRKRRQARTEVPKEAEATKLQSSEELPSRDSVRYLMRFLIRRLIEGEEHQPYALLRVPCGWKKGIYKQSSPWVTGTRDGRRGTLPDRIPLMFTTGAERQSPSHR